MVVFHILTVTLGALMETQPTICDECYFVFLVFEQVFGIVELTTVEPFWDIHNGLTHVYHLLKQQAYKCVTLLQQDVSIMFT